MNKNNNIYLKESDIKNLGFEKIKKIWVGYDSYILNDINPNYGYYLKATLHTPIESYRNSPNLVDSFSKIFVHRWLEGFVEKPYIHDESRSVFEGIIKNELELNKLLKQLGIL